MIADFQMQTCKSPGPGMAVSQSFTSTRLNHRIDT